MKILATSTTSPTATQVQFAPHLREETLLVWKLHKAGTLREIYFRQNSYDVVLMLECATADEAKAILDTLPLVKAGLITFEISALVPYASYEMLFSPT